MSFRKAHEIGRVYCVLLLALAFLIGGCSSGSDTPAPHFQSDPNTQGQQSNLTPTGSGGGITQTTVEGSMPSAPLGTDPAYGVQEVGGLITTTKVSATSSAKGTSADDRINWVAITPAGTPVIPGTDSPPIYEGQQVEFYINYNVFEGELSISRNWYCDAAGLDYVEDVDHDSPGTYQAVFPFTMPYGSVRLLAEFTGVIAPPKGASVVVVPDMGNKRGVVFQVLSVDTQPYVYYPSIEDGVPDGNDADEGGCMPQDIYVEFTDGSHTAVQVECDKDLSNVVLVFEDGSKDEKWDNLSGYTIKCYGTGNNIGKKIKGCYVHSGCNNSGAGPGYGEYWTPIAFERLALAQMVWEDTLVGTEYDYNDFVGRIRIAETRNLSGDLVQAKLTVKASARAAGYDAQWQFNIGAAFPGASNVLAVVNQYYNDGSRHGGQRIYQSAEGMSVPIFIPLREALPNPPESNVTNGIPGTTFIYGDYADITIIFNNPVAAGTYSPMPYDPELRVLAGGGNIYVIPMWSEPGDPVDANGRPLAFIVPDTFPWALEAVPVTTPYPEFQDWVDWINDQSLPEPDPAWYDYEPVTQFFDRALFN